MTTGGSTFLYDYTRAGALGQKNGSTVRFYLSDLHGDVVGLLKPDHTSAGSTEFDAWGNKVASQTTGTQAYLGFQGDPTDADTGWVDMGARKYLASLGRFMTQDPLFGDIRNPTSLNQFAYGADNPMTFVDPDGLCPRDPDNPGVCSQTAPLNEVKATNPYWDPGHPGGPILGPPSPSKPLVPPKPEPIRLAWGDFVTAVGPRVDGFLLTRLPQASTGGPTGFLLFDIPGFLSNFDIFGTFQEDRFRTGGKVPDGKVVLTQGSVSYQLVQGGKAYGSDALYLVTIDSTAKFGGSTEYFRRTTRCFGATAPLPIRLTTIRRLIPVLAARQSSPRGAIGSFSRFFTQPTTARPLH
jgi:RHS repeat-associated protein